MNTRRLRQACLLALVCACWAQSGFAQDTSRANSVDAQFRAMDTNGDGKVSPEEHAAGAKKMFEMMDANKDGKVNAAEMEASHQKITGRKPAKGEMSAAEKIKAVDTNGDGILTAEEHAAGSRMMFGRMDTSRDGFLSKAEMEAGHARLMAKTGTR